MSGDLRERATGTAAAALIVALACAALASGALAVEQLEVRRVSASLAALGTASIVPPGTVLQVETAPARPYYPIRRAYRLELADGRLVGFGMSVIVSWKGGAAEMYVVVDAQGQVRSTAMRSGISGSHAVDMDMYVRQRSQGASGGLGLAADVRTLEYAVRMALEAGSHFARERMGGTP